MEKEEMRDTTQYGDPDRRGYMGQPHRPEHTTARAPEDREVRDGTALTETDPTLTGIDRKNPNVNDADVGDSRLVDPGRPNGKET